MKKLVGLILGLTMIGGLVLTAGCGSSGNSGAGVSFSAVLAIAASVSTGGASTAAFAASFREASRPAIMAAANTKYEARVYVKTSDWSQVAKTTDLELSDLNSDGNYDKIALKSSVPVNSAISKLEYRVEFLAIGAPESTTATSLKKVNPNAIFAQYGVAELSHGQTLPVTLQIDPEKTARAFAYDQWSGRDTAGLTYNDFQPDSSKVILAQTNVESDLNTKLKTADSAFAYSATTQQSFTDVAASATGGASTTTSSGNLSKTDLIGSWNRIKQSKSSSNASIETVLPNTSGKFCTITFGSDGTFSYLDYAGNYNSSGDWQLTDAVYNQGTGVWSMTDNRVTIVILGQASVFTFSKNADGTLNDVGSNGFIEVYSK